ncbi:hypothetical protein Tco_1124542 [Tanacetum coccineum]|uniref:Uncharacterized protein n=1 Tax=Tanacetum coccineum TaxID=301880 RepID=A0ABQ5J6E9_9ASTR
MAGDDYERPPVFDDDQYEEESMPVYDTDIEDVIEEEEGFIEKGGFGGKEDNIEDVVVVANDLCSSMIQTTLNVDFEKDINTKSHELVSFAKSSYYQDLFNNFFNLAASTNSDIQHPASRPKNVNTSTCIASDIMYLEASPNMLMKTNTQESAATVNTPENTVRQPQCITFVSPGIMPRVQELPRHEMLIRGDESGRFYWMRCLRGYSR